MGININYLVEKFNYHLVKQLPRSFDNYLFHIYPKEDLVGIEIGVFEGKHAECLLKNPKIKFLYLIDEYKQFNDVDGYQLNMDKAEMKAHYNLLRFKDKTSKIKENSDEAHKHFENESVDFVYIDGGHSYEQCKKDIENYYPKVKRGGIIGGHDFACGNVVETPIPCGVVEAVLEFCDKNGYSRKIFINNYNWWIIKE